MVTNKYKVPQKLWRKFTEVGQKVFNEVMSQSLKNQELTCHPNQDEIPKDQWKTICWNFSCYAAWSVAKEPLKKGSVVIDLDKKGKEVRKRKVA